MFKVITFCWDAGQRDEPTGRTYGQCCLCRPTDGNRPGCVQVFNYYNSHLWAENCPPHAPHVANHQHNCSLNVWAAMIVDDFLELSRIQSKLMDASINAPTKVFSSLRNSSTPLCRCPCLVDTSFL